MNAKPYVIGNDRELFIDDWLIAERRGVEFSLHRPEAHTPEPSAPVGYYMTMIQDGIYIRCYARRNFGEYGVANAPFRVKSGFVNEYTGYWESRYSDQHGGGVRFMEPPLFLYDCGVPNVLLTMTVGILNFTPFLDTNPACPPEQRYKATGGVCDQGGIFGFVSPDGLHFQRIQEAPIFPALPEFRYCFDSQNVCFYSEAEGCYVLYFRINHTPDGRELRTVGKSTSPDFIHWTKPVFPELNRDNEQLYVTLIAPYRRAPKLYIGTPTRFREERGCATDITLVFSRAGGEFIRPFPGAWIPPGPDPARWENRANYLAYNPVQTAPHELSFYHALNQVRYTLRTDGFISLSAGTEGGEVLTRPLRYDGGRLEFNVATSAYGMFALELTDVEGKALPGYSFADCDVFWGDRIAFHPTWREREAALAPGTVCRIRMRLTEADCYSMAFAAETDAG